MRSLLLSLALGLGAAGIAATTPGSAKAFWPVTVTGGRFNGTGNVNVFGVPVVRVQNNGFGITETVFSPGGYRTVFTPNGVTRLWYGSSMTTINFNPITGLTARSTSPSITGFVFTPYLGFRSVGFPSLNSVSAMNAFGQTASFSTLNGLANMGTWRGMTWPMVNIPIPGTGSFFSTPLANMPAMGNMPAGSSTMPNGNSIAAASGPQGPVATAYSDYVPSGYISN
jgi:hypothetical protein